MKYYHRNYFFLLTASALTTVLWSLTYTTSRYRTRFSPVSYTHLHSLIFLYELKCIYVSKITINVFNTYKTG